MSQQASLLISVLALCVGVQSDDDGDAKKNRYDIIIDDISWLASLIFLVGIVVVCYCMAGYDTQTVKKEECCCKDKVIHVYIEPRDAMKKYNSHLTRQDQAPDTDA